VIYERKVDVTTECARLKKDLEALQKRIDVAAFQLGNQNFRSKAPQRVVEGLIKQLDEARLLRDKTRSKMEDLHCG
jgi:valyl-tRNA synthetase